MLHSCYLVTAVCRLHNSGCRQTCHISISMSPFHPFMGREYPVVASAPMLSHEPLVVSFPVWVVAKSSTMSSHSSSRNRWTTWLPASRPPVQWFVQGPLGTSSIFPDIATVYFFILLSFSECSARFSATKATTLQEWGSSQLLSEPTHHHSGSVSLADSWPPISVFQCSDSFHCCLCNCHSSGHLFYFIYFI